MTEKDEILVHVSASASRQNDDLFRSLAQAYLHFEPLEVNPIEVPMGHRVPNAAISKDSYGSFPSQLDSANPSGSQTQTDTQISSSLDEDSYPTGRLSRLEQIHERWRAEAKPGPAPVQHSSSGAPPSSVFSDDAFLDDTQLAYQVVESQILEEPPATSEYPSEDYSEEYLPEDCSEDCSELHESQFESNNNSQAKSNTTTANFEAVPFEVFPPAPVVTVQTPKRLPSQITDYLGTLKRTNPHRFKAKTKLRTLEADERGCWIVDTRSWPSHLQLDFWTSLVDHIESGSFGWGVTLHRESMRASELGTIRIYCWGEIAEHIWLALWLCSRGKISGTVSSWVDAGEEVVIKVR